MKLLFLGVFLYDYDILQEDIIELGFFEKNNYLIILNLETQLKSNTPIKKWINLYNSKRLIDVLKTLNVVAVNVAKNHNMDWGKSGLEGLLSDLKSNNILLW